MKRYLVEDNMLRYGTFIGFLHDIPSIEFKFNDVWTVVKHLYYYIVTPNQKHPYCDCEKIRRDINRAISEGYLTTNGIKKAFKYIKTEKLLSEKFIKFHKIN